MDATELEASCASDATVVYDWSSTNHYKFLLIFKASCCSATWPNNRLWTLGTVDWVRLQCGVLYNTDTTRLVYMQKLNQLQQDPKAQRKLAAGAKVEQGFKWELAAYMNGNLTLPSKFVLFFLFFSILSWSLYNESCAIDRYRNHCGPNTSW